ncbi:alpha/beta hydrolase [Streptomyces sp. CB02923]|uniref:alpha/beta fold hydrolase n=1 Tax=Streptomyces sp. CB02923 TaxID=1718985 RepID=UPI00093E2564|nr:alpha/beta hydrolase [Streptomyces sp. CB02923]OKI02223.1 alpha/beta hydrolase [Streptomyces sp. CB02923]
MGEQRASQVGPSRIRMAYESFGADQAPAVVLVMGGGAQMIAWPEGFCAELVGHGLRVIRFDNRDTGRSSHFPDVAVPGPGTVGDGPFSPVSYTLSDMAGDIIGLLDVLGLDRVHLVGASLGGMIAQTMAIEHPARTRSLTSLMSTTGDLSVGRSDPAALAALGAPPPDREGFIAWQLRALRTVGSPGYAFDEAAVAERAARAYERGHDPAGMVRQFAAAAASGDRTAQLRALRVPALVIHGTDDVLIDISGGRATATAVPGAGLAIIDGMGHSLPRALWPRLALLIAHLVHRAEDPGRRAPYDGLSALPVAASRSR